MFGEPTWGYTTTLLEMCYTNSSILQKSRRPLCYPHSTLTPPQHPCRSTIPHNFSRPGPPVRPGRPHTASSSHGRCGRVTHREGEPCRHGSTKSKLTHTALPGGSWVPLTATWKHSCGPTPNQPDTLRDTIVTDIIFRISANFNN
jgi:hypothetical protein